MKRKTIGILFATGVIAWLAVFLNKMKKRLEKDEKMANKHLELFLLMNQWVKVKQIGKNLSSYLAQEGYKEIAIYGMHYAGETLVEELMGTDIKVKYGIDQNITEVLSGIPVVTPDSVMECVDAIIVTPIVSFNEIKQQLEKKTNCPIISLEDILYLV